MVAGAVGNERDAAIGQVARVDVVAVAVRDLAQTRAIGADLADVEAGTRRVVASREEKAGAVVADLEALDPAVGEARDVPQLTVRLRRSRIRIVA